MRRRQVRAGPIGRREALAGAAGAGVRMECGAQDVDYSEVLDCVIAAPGSNYCHPLLTPVVLRVAKKSVLPLTCSENNKRENANSDDGKPIRSHSQESLSPLGPTLLPIDRRAAHRVG